LKSKRAKQKHADAHGGARHRRGRGRNEPSRGPGWLHEIKHDGYRVELHLRDGRVRLFSRTAKDWATQFVPIAKSARALAAREAIIDARRWC
jgi:ATP-dependent DNA ligase